MWKRIIAPAFVVSLFWIGVGISTSFYLYWQGKTLDRILEQDVTSIVAAKAVQEATWRTQSAILQSVIDDSISAESIRDELGQQFEQFQRTTEFSATLPEEKNLLDDIASRFADYSARCRQAMDKSMRNDTTLTELRQSASQFVESCEAVVRIKEQVVRDASNHRRQLTTRIVTVRTALLFVGPGLGLWMGFRLARQLNQSITKISVSLQSFAGDMEQEIGGLEITPQADLPVIQQQLDIITERMRGVVQELHQSRKETMRAERLAAVGELAAGVAHEIRNPLTSVKLLIQTMQHRNQQPIPHETFDVVLEEISRMEATIQGLLDFARPPVLQTAVQDLRHIVRRAVNLTDGKARQNHVEITLDLPDDAVWVNVDAGQLHQVCVNILLNGLESMTTGGGFNIHVTADKAGGLARVRFEDSGEGIPETILPRLFEPFVTSKEYGTGLGLAVSRRIISNHSGRLFAENRPEGGATLTIELGLNHIPNQQVQRHAHALVD